MDFLHTEDENIALKKTPSTENVPAAATSDSTAPTTTSVLSPSHPETLIRREHESVDDFEHLEHELSPVKEKIIAEPKMSVKETDPVKGAITEVGNEVASILVGGVAEVVNKQKSLIDMEFEDHAAASKVTDSLKSGLDFLDQGIPEKQDETHVMEPTAMSSLNVAPEIHKAATTPVFPSHLADTSSDDQFDAIRKVSPFDMSDKIQFESGIDLSDIMGSDKKTDEEQQHVPKAKEELEAVYRTEPKHSSSLKVDGPEEMDAGHVSDREDDAAFVMAEKEDEIASAPTPEPDTEEEEPPVPLPKDYDEEPAAAKGHTPPSQTKKQPAPTRAAEDEVEIAACDLSGLCEYALYLGVWRGIVW